MLIFFCFWRNKSLDFLRCQYFTSDNAPSQGFLFSFQKKRKKKVAFVLTIAQHSISMRKKHRSLQYRRKKKKGQVEQLQSQFCWKRIFLVLKILRHAKWLFQNLLRKFSWNSENPDSNFKILLFSSLKQKTLKMPKKNLLKRFLKHFDPFFLLKNLKENERLNTLVLNSEKSLKDLNQSLQ